MLYNNYTTVVNGNNVIIGIPLGCTQGTWVAVCNDGTNSANVADIICKSAGFSGKSRYIRQYNSNMHCVKLKIAVLMSIFLSSSF